MHGRLAGIQGIVSIDYYFRAVRNRACANGGADRASERHKRAVSGHTRREWSLSPRHLWRLHPTATRARGGYRFLSMRGHLELQRRSGEKTRERKEFAVRAEMPMGVSTILVNFDEIENTEEGGGKREFGKRSEKFATVLNFPLVHTVGRKAMSSAMITILRPSRVSTSTFFLRNGAFLLFVRFIGKLFAGDSFLQNKVRA